MFRFTSLRALIIGILMSIVTLMVADFFMVERHWIIRILQILTIVILVVADVIVIFLRWVSVEESTVAVITRGGAVKRYLFHKEGHRLDENYNLVADPSYVYSWPFSGPWSEWLGNLLGGLRFYVWYFEGLHTYDWEWEKTLSNGKVESRSEKGEYLTFVGYSYPYAIELGTGIITSDNIPVFVSMVVNAEIDNPKKALFNGKWFITFTAGLRTPSREYVNKRTYDEVNAAAARSVGEDELFGELSTRVADTKDGRNRSVIQVLLEDHGVRVLRVGFSSVDTTPEYKKILAQQKQGEMDAAQRNASGMGAIVAMVGTALGMTIADVQSRFKSSIPFSENELKIIEASRDLLEQQIAAAAPGSSALKSYRFKGASGGMDLVALIGDALRGGGGSPSPSIPSVTSSLPSGESPPVRGSSESDESYKIRFDYWERSRKKKP